uniref:CBS domain-containing protein n=1 Tax=Amphora coffeiformis TaxID=265554 RepID=A0A7S3LFN4_9STRA|mmetsp:Transcript_13864/g.26600  ORF Transcript_13864/g.26600 Transcript_13864/m.26600 type:complete len:151 (-) Transcript_13864:163-615(-)
MKVSSFMVPKNQVISCAPEDTLEKAMNLMLDSIIGSIVVLSSDGAPIGIVTKTDLLRGWSKGMDAKKNTVSDVMGTTIETILDTAPTGIAAEHFEKKKHRHAFVVDKDGTYVGIVTAYDIAVETARDNKAWPYTNRDAIAEKYRVPTQAH